MELAKSGGGLWECKGERRVVGFSNGKEPYHVPLAGEAKLDSFSPGKFGISSRYKLPRLILLHFLTLNYFANS